MYGRANYEERIPTYSLAGRFALTREFGRKCPSCQGKPPLPIGVPYITIILSLSDPCDMFRSFYPN